MRENLVFFTLNSLDLFVVCLIPMFSISYFETLNFFEFEDQVFEYFKNFKVLLDKF